MLKEGSHYPVHLCSFFFFFQLMDQFFDFILYGKLSPAHGAICMECSPQRWGPLNFMRNDNNNPNGQQRRRKSSYFIICLMEAYYGVYKS